LQLPYLIGILSGGVVKLKKSPRGRPPGGRVRVTYKFKPEVVAALSEAASIEGVTKSAFAERAVAKASGRVIARHQKGAGEG
jgi:hypothetical protein